MRAWPARSRSPATPKRRWQRRRWQAAPSPCRLSSRWARWLPVSLWNWRRRRQRRRPSRQPFHPALPRSGPLPRHRRLKTPAWFHPICRTWSCWTWSFQPCRRCRPLRPPWCRLCRHRGAWPPRRGRWSRCARLCRMQPCPTTRGLCRARGCRMLPASRPSGAERMRSPGCDRVRDCRCCRQRYCCPPASRSCRFRQIDSSRRALTSLLHSEKTRLPILLT